MGYSKLKRKNLKNRMRATAKVDTIKRINSKPVISNIDVQEIKKSFAEAK